MANVLTKEDEDLLAELGVDEEEKNNSTFTAREERVIAGFEDIQRFVEKHGRTPQYGEAHDIFERLYAVRLDRLRELTECRTLLSPIDHQGLLSHATARQQQAPYTITDDELIAELGDMGDMADPTRITELKHVRARAEIKAAEEIASREKCADFDRFQPLLLQTEREIKAGIRQTRPFGKDASIELGNFFILGGQLVYVAEVGEIFRAPNGDEDARLRVIYANGTESNLLLRSLQRALYKDEAGRRVTEPSAGPLFGDTQEDDDIESGTIYVLRSQSDHSFVAQHRELIHKIGVTGGEVETRIAGADHDATYLLAAVDVVACYKLVGINRVKLENLFHRIFAPAQIDVTINDRFGHPFKPKEWFLVPLNVIDEAVQHVRDGSITNMVYDPKTARLVG